MWSWQRDGLRMQLLLWKTGKTRTFARIVSKPVELRDYSKVNHKFVSEYVKSVREERYEGYYGGIHPTEFKELSEHISVVPFPDPVNVSYSYVTACWCTSWTNCKSRRSGKNGSKLLKQLALSAIAIHASVSGTVVAVEPRLHQSAGLKP